MGGGECEGLKRKRERGRERVYDEKERVYTVINFTRYFDIKLIQNNVLKRIYGHLVK